jgi:hypothetical protein
MKSAIAQHKEGFLKTFSLAREFGLNSYGEITTWLNSLAGTSLPAIGTIDYVTSITIANQPGGCVVVSLVVIVA